MFTTSRITLAAFATVAAVAAGSASAATVEVHVTGVAAGKGKVSVAVCDREHYLKECVYHATAPAQAGDNVIRIAGVPAGTWAVLVFQDKNENGKLDQTLFGIPLEDYGFSRDARGHFGAPSFEDAAIEVKADPTVANVKIK
ncbi:DUF2141 domain-containing protein [Massilia sp. 9096]|uniref:DUF2141 domain-containing protein n=1 Tax=Massilia sp. 9096 TaxID=1500894 RepID=UPI000563C56D|nr:DUF2141 domain-containing protein [Massilia sp. 9096]